MKRRCSYVFSSIMAAAMVVLMPFFSKAQTLDYKLESMFVFSFTKYIEWPTEKQAGNFIIGVFGDSPLTEELNKFIGTKHVGDRSITVRVVHTMEEIAGCHILFIPVTQSGKLWEICAATKGKPTLIVAEKSGLIKKGAGICLFLDEDDDYKTKFELNKITINENGMLVSTNLMQLAYHLIK